MSVKLTKQHQNSSLFPVGFLKKKMYKYFTIEIAPDKEPKKITRTFFIIMLKEQNKCPAGKPNAMMTSGMSTNML